MTITRTVVLSASFALAMAASASAAPAPAAPPPAPPRGRGAAAPANLDGAMKSLDTSLRALKADAIDPARQEQALRAIATMQRDVATSKLQVPPTINRMQGDERTKALTSYRGMLNDLLASLAKLETAVLDKKADDAKKVIADIEAIEKKGHETFMAQ